MHATEKSPADMIGRAPYAPLPLPALAPTLARSVAMTLVLALAACGGPQPGNLQGEWAGTLRTEKGRCPTERPSRLLVDGKEISFVPGGGVLVLQGTRAPDGKSLHAQLALTDADRKPLPMVFEGAMATDGTSIDGTYGTPACRASIVLHRPEHHAFERALGN
ncbi:hypothetical protein NFI95_04295 [Acetobacteraceae bacterium KSS8]|uniref:Lipoprotein n=1 Tax=Endosaccharibacter trunci TaxID=2812733 RepID=A0ABT1W754_9PROT|nr:hypothetical protein [Acetobacteraceae bacterium KSS8]